MPVALNLVILVVCMCPFLAFFSFSEISSSKNLVT